MVILFGRIIKSHHTKGCQMTRDSEITIFRTVYVERFKTTAGNSFRVTRCVNMQTPLPGDVLTEAEYGELVKNKYIRVICDSDGKVSNKG